MSFATWAAGVLLGIGGPASASNLDTLFAWANAESGPDVMRWNNPLNTTEPWTGAVNMNPVGVKRYLSENDGMAATVATLLNGDYPSIVSHLRNSVPRAQWVDCCAELGTWGTGCGWLNSYFGAVPGVATEVIDMTPEEHGWLEENVQMLQRLCYALGVTNPAQLNSAVSTRLQDLEARIGNAPPAQPKTLSGTISGTLT